MSANNTYKTVQPIQILFISMIMFCAANLVTQQTVAESKPDTMQGQVMKPNAIKLARCPSSPNCVNSQISTDKKHFIEPIKLNDSNLENNRNKLLEVLNTFPRVKIVTIEDNYIKAEFSSKLFSFVDDVEFVISDNKIDVRSASRTGYHDLGANKKRINDIRKKLK